MTEQSVGFAELNKWLHKSKTPIDIDTGTLLFVCAYRHRHAYNAGDYLPSVLAFHRQLIILSVVNKWKFTAILDGASPAEKAFEHQRRVDKEGSISINSTYIAMCAKVCRTMFIDFVVAPEEADMQVGRRSNSTTAMGCDSDLMPRKQTPAGERPLRAEYLVMMHLAILPTTHASHGHTLGLCLRVMRSYCGLCKAGCGMCIHRAGCLWMQHLHWGEGRPTPKPSTAEFCTWLPGSNCDRTVTTLLPAARTSIMQLPGSNEEAKRKHEHGHTKTGHVGETARYDWHGGNEKVLAELNDPGYTSKERVMPLLQYLQDILQESSSDVENE